MRIEGATIRKPRWVGGSVFNNPSSGTVLADSGPISAASPLASVYEYVVVASTTVPAQLLIEHRNVDNSSTLESFNVLLPAGVVAFPVPVRITQNERVRVVLVSAITGSISVGLLETRTHD